MEVGSEGVRWDTGESLGSMGRPKPRTCLTLAFLGHEKVWLALTENYLWQGHCEMRAVSVGAPCSGSILWGEALTALV